MRALWLGLVVGCNTAPGAPEVVIEPAEPSIDDALIARIVAGAHDPEGDPVTYTWRWSVDDQPVPELTGDTVPAGTTRGRERWTVEVTPSDGALDGPPVTATVVVANTVPTVSVAISPESPIPGEPLEALIVAEDRDGDPTTLGWSWQVDGVPADLDGVPVPEGRTSACERWTVVAFADDGFESSAEVSAEVVIGDHAPAVDGLTLAPAAPLTDEDVTAIFTLSDADGDDVEAAVTWRVDGVVVAESSATLSGEHFARGQSVEVTVVPDDGCVEGPAAVAAVVVANAAPTATGARIEPSILDERTTATCVGEGFADRDGDPAGWTFEWTVDGAVVASTETIDGSAFDRGQTVTCAAFPFDGLTVGAPVASAPITVVNAPPELSAIAISPVLPSRLDDPTVSFTALDPDGDALTTSIRWLEDGAVVGEGLSLEARDWPRGTTFVARIQTSDGQGGVVEADSAPVTLVNAPPSVTSVTVGPTDVRTDGVLVAVASAADVDGDPVAVRWSWEVDGVAVGADSPTLDGSWFDEDDVVVATGTPNDGADDGVPRSSSPVTVANSPPSAPVVTTDPPPPSTDADDVTCLLVTASSDADGDAVTYSWSWLYEGVETLHVGPVLTGVTQAGDWTCVATPSDDDGPGLPGEVTIYLQREAATASLATADATFAGAEDAIGLGDVDGDGGADLLFGVAGFDDGPRTDVGALTVHSGTVRGEVDVVVDAALVVIPPGEDQFAGHGLAVGDLDGDGLVDAALGAPYYGPINGGGGYDGAVYLIDLVPADLGSSAITHILVGEANTVGYELALSPDLDGDGQWDLIVGASDDTRTGGNNGAVYVVGGPAPPSDLGLSRAVIVGDDLGEYRYNEAGWAVSSGDLDGDGLDDVLYAIYETLAATRTGGVYRFESPVGILGNDDADTVWSATLAWGSVGESIAAGDLDGDGYAELLVGAPGWDATGAYSGAVFVVAGGPSPAGGPIDTAADAILVGATAGEQLSVPRFAGDVDGDGASDLAATSLVYDAPGTGTGALWVFHGPIAGDLDTSMADLARWSEDTVSYAGTELSAGQDVNADGHDDLLVGSSNDPAYLIFGQ